MDHVISFDPSGQVEAMHTDKFPLGFLGQQQITRASDIRFDAEEQKWGIWLALDNGEFLEASGVWSEFDGYEEARAFEVVALNACREKQIKPVSIEGELLAESLRWGV